MLLGGLTSCHHNLIKEPIIIILAAMAHSTTKIRK